MVISKKTIIFQSFSEGGGGNICQGGGGPTFSSGGVQMLISIETHNLWFSRGGGGPDPISPLWIRTCT